MTDVGQEHGERAATFGYFTPTMVGLMNRSTVDAEVLAGLGQ